MHRRPDKALIFDCQIWLFGKKASVQAGFTFLRDKPIIKIGENIPKN